MCLSVCFPLSVCLPTCPIKGRLVDIISVRVCFCLFSSCVRLPTCPIKVRLVDIVLSASGWFVCFSPNGFLCCLSIFISLSVYLLTCPIKVRLVDIVCVHVSVCLYFSQRLTAYLLHQGETYRYHMCACVCLFFFLTVCLFFSQCLSVFL